jgi:transmembrane sensor
MSAMPDDDDIGQMTEPQHLPADPDTLKREAQQWVTRLTSGEATAADAEALKRWRLTSRAHRQAFAEANLLWDKLRPAAAEAATRSAGSAEAVPATRFPTGRRAFLGGVLAATAAAATYVVVRPPLELWPSLAEISADYRTGIGQQQQIALPDNTSVKLNTRTSIDVIAALAGEDQANQIELVAGEAAFATAPQNARPFTVVAAQGRTIASNARFNIRRDGGTVCVTCVEGEVRIEHLGRASRLQSRQQLVYTGAGLGQAEGADPEAVTAWQRGFLIFRNDPLARVIEEVNRYRPGKIILMSEELGRRPVLATFRIDRIDEVVPRLVTVFGVQVRTLPGGVVLVS